MKNVNFNSIDWVIRTKITHIYPSKSTISIACCHEHNAIEFFIVKKPRATVDWSFYAEMLSINTSQTIGKRILGKKTISDGKPVISLRKGQVLFM